MKTLTDRVDIDKGEVRYRRGVTYAFAGFYADNLADALLFGKEDHDYEPGGLSAVAHKDGEAELRFSCAVGRSGSRPGSNKGSNR